MKCQKEQQVAIVNISLLYKNVLFLTRWYWTICGYRAIHRIVFSFFPSLFGRDYCPVLSRSKDAMGGRTGAYRICVIHTVLLGYLRFLKSKLFDERNIFSRAPLLIRSHARPFSLEASRSKASISMFSVLCSKIFSLNSQSYFVPLGYCT